MATNTTMKSSSILPMAASDPPPRMEEKLFRGSAMTKRGAYAAISYMICAGMTFCFRAYSLCIYRFLIHLSSLES